MISTHDFYHLRSLLPRTWDRWLARFGRPTDIQRIAIPHVLAGRDTLIMAPTASGKTEAALVPLLERYGAELRREGPPVILVLSPTKALVNDLYRRLEGRLGEAGIAAGRWTGDGRDKGRLQRIAFLTLEALDGRLSRDPESLLAARALWLEEVHVVDGGVRGDQLQILVARLRARLAHEGKPALQVIATSATLPDAAGVARRYVGAEAAVARPEAGAGRRLEVAIELAPAEVEDDPERFRARLVGLVREGCRKLLVFVDNRARVEVIASLLRGHAPFGHAAYAHHGSMEAPARAEVEQRFLQDRVAVCVATSTLEVGIDIGDIDAVVLLDAPSTVPGLLQRAGRSGRRGGGARVLGWVADPVEGLTLKVLAAAALRGEWLADPVTFRPSVLVQQCMSILGEREKSGAFGLQAAHVHRRLPPGLAAEWDELRLERLMMGMCGAGWLKAAKGRYCWGEAGDAQWQRGELHTNLGGGRATPGIAVVDALSGAVIGRVQEAGEVGTSVSMGGQSRRILHSGEGRIVTESGSRVMAAPVFGSAPGAPMPGAQARALLAAVGVRPGDAVQLGDGAIAVAHGLGTGAGRVMGALFSTKKGVFVRGRGPLATVLQPGSRLAALPPGEALALIWPRYTPDVLSGPLAEDLAERLGMGPYHGLLPETEQVRALEAAVQAAAIRGFLSMGAPPVRALPPPETPEETLREALLLRW